MKSLLLGHILCLFASLLLLLGAGTQRTVYSQGTTDSGPVSSGDASIPDQVYFSGDVVQENGMPAAGAFIELDCQGSVTREATVDSAGHFSFPYGEGIRHNQQDQDLSRNVTDPFGRNSEMIPFDVGLISTRSGKLPKKPIYSNKLLGCSLRAALKGFKSSSIELGTAPFSTILDVGTIVVFPIEKVRGATTSTTSLLAPKSAKKALKKAKEALRKNRAGDAEKYLKSAIALYPKYGEAWFELGKLCQVQRRIQDARDSYTKAIESDNRYATPYVWLGLLSAAEQKWEATADLTHRALALDPASFPEAYYLNALANFNLKNLVQAEKSALKASLMDSAHRFPKLHLILAGILAGRADMVGTIEELRKYIKYGPRGKNAIQDYAGAPYLDSVWESASEELKQEMALSAGLSVRLTLAEALLGAGMGDHAKAEIKAYMENGDLKKIPPRLQDLLEDIQDQKERETHSGTSTEAAGNQREESIDYLVYSLRNLPDFEPAHDLTSIDGIVAAAGNNVSGLFTNLFNLSAVENVQLERIDRKGNMDRNREFEYLYLCLGTVDRQNPYFDEYRSDKHGNELLQLGLEEGYMLTAGFMSAPIIFYPLHHDGSSFRLLGYQKLGGRNTVVVAYAQIPARSRLKGSFRVGKEVHEIFKQGIAWIDAENYQLIRLVSDLLQPLPDIGLEQLRTEIDFDEIQFNQSMEKFRLPVRVVVTVKWDGRILRNTHTYSNFKHFEVQTMQWIEEPKRELE